MVDILFPEDAAGFLADPDGIPSAQRAFLERVRKDLGGIDLSSALYRLAYNVVPSDERPMAGHAVRLTGPLNTSTPAGSIGIILGVVGRTPDHFCIAFHPGQVFRGPRYNDDPHNFDRWIVTSNGGPITDQTNSECLTPTRERTSVEFWMWSHHTPPAWTYTLSVPVWEWCPVSHSVERF